jgi:signal transduction histidine kinase
MMTQAEKENNGRLEMKFSTELPDNFSIHSNRRAMEKILEQLLSNAMKFTEEGYVALKVEASPDHDVVRFVIEDTGIGIADKHHEKVFERFYKVDAFKQGFGLGLTISRKMAILLGGGISIDNEYTDGARFFLILPI